MKSSLNHYVTLKYYTEIRRTRNSWMFSIFIKKLFTFHGPCYKPIRAVKPSWSEFTFVVQIEWSQWCDCPTCWYGLCTKSPFPVFGRNGDLGLANPSSPRFCNRNVTHAVQMFIITTIQSLMKSNKSVASSIVQAIILLLILLIFYLISTNKYDTLCHMISQRRRLHETKGVKGSTTSKYKFCMKLLN